MRVQKADPYDIFSKDDFFLFFQYEEELWRHGCLTTNSILRARKYLPDMPQTGISAANEGLGSQED